MARKKQDYIWAKETAFVIKNVPLVIKRNIDRFPSDFMFQLTPEEYDSLRSQFVISKGKGGRRYLPYAFTEQGVAMLSSVLNSHRAVKVNIAIMRAFVHLRRMIVSHADLAKKLTELEAQFKDHSAIPSAAGGAILQSEPAPEVGYHRLSRLVGSSCPVVLWGRLVTP